MKVKKNGVSDFYKVLRAHLQLLAQLKGVLLSLPSGLEIEGKRVRWEAVQALHQLESKLIFLLSQEGGKSGLTDPGQGKRKLPLLMPPRQHENLPKGADPRPDNQEARNFSFPELLKQIRSVLALVGTLLALMKGCSLDENG